MYNVEYKGGGMYYSPGNLNSVKTCYFYSDLGHFLLLRARGHLRLWELNFLNAYLLQEYQDKCSSAINEVKINLLSKNRFFSQKAPTRAHFCSDLFKTKKMHVLYIILSSHAKNQPPTTMLSYVYTLFKFPGE